MTVKELKKELETLPENAECFFTLYTINGRQSYWFNPSLGNKLMADKQGNVYAQIAYTDDCPAYKLTERELITLKL